MRCHVCGCDVRRHGSDGCHGVQYLLPGVAEGCVCGLDQDQAATIPPDQESAATS